MSSTDFARARPAPLFDRWWNRLVVVVEIGVLVNVVAGLLGLFGTGPLSSAELRCATPPVTVAYQRITRRSLQSDLQISTTGPIAAPSLDVVLPRAFTEAFDVAFTSPPAHVVRTDHDGDVYTFDFGPSREGEIRFAVKARAAAWLDATLKIGDGRVPLRLVVLP